MKDAAEDWSGRALSWGVNGLLVINAHAFIDFNAFYSTAPALRPQVSCRRTIVCPCWLSRVTL